MLLLQVNNASISAPESFNLLLFHRAEFLNLRRRQFLLYLSSDGGGGVDSTLLRYPCKFLILVLFYHAKKNNKNKPKKFSI